jgi:small-conductance mechanosensitive channel
MIQGLARVGQAVDTVATSATRLVENVTGLGPEFQRKLLLSCLIVIALVALRRVVLRFAHRRYEDARVRYRWSKATGYVAFGLGFLLVLNVLVGTITSLGTFLGLLSAGLAIALKDLVTNLAGWLFILLRRPFDVGDRVQIGPHAGDVVDRRIFQFTLLEIGNWVDADQSTGRVIHVPNQKVFTEPLANYTAQFDYLWNEVPVLVTFESDWRRAKARLTEIANEHAQPLSQGAQAQLRRAASRHMIFFRNLTPIVYTTVKDSGVQLSIRYLTPARQRRASAERLWEAILDRLAQEPTIDLAYPTVRRFSNVIEGKPAARAPTPPVPPVPPVPSAPQGS